MVIPASAASTNNSLLKKKPNESDYSFRVFTHSGKVTDIDEEQGGNSKQDKTKKECRYYKQLDHAQVRFNLTAERFIT